jgi:uncharacterized membrane protein YtjA (UPF0391 family)
VAYYLIGSHADLGTNRLVLHWILRTASEAVPITEMIMLNWAILFLIVALVAAVLGFGGIAGTAIGIAKIIFVVAIVLFLISAVMHLMRRA